MKNHLQETMNAFRDNGVLDQVGELGRLRAEIDLAEEEIARLNVQYGMAECQGHDASEIRDEIAAQIQTRNAAQAAHDRLYAQMVEESHRVHGAR